MNDNILIRIAGLMLAIIITTAIICIISPFFKKGNLCPYCVYSFADNVSFRRLMTPPSTNFDAYNETYEKSYFNILDYVSEHGTFIEQTIQDYYVYEIWEINGTNVTFSYSDMNALTNVENEEDDSIIREFIVHPDGVISGSWNEGKKVILDASE